jgi:hypothetical protein
MCQNWLAIFKNSCPLSTRSIVTSSASDVHFPRCVKLTTLFILASFLLVLEILVDYWSCRLFEPYV